MKSLMELLAEGVYDPAIFKAIFLAGGSGSGKSYVSNQITGGLGYKVVNSDNVFEFLLKKQNLPVDLRTLDPNVRDAVRGKAKQVTRNMENAYLEGRLGIIIDGTGADYSKLYKIKQKLEDLGYSTYMVFVYTTLDVAIERNLSRERKVPVEILKIKWEEAMSHVDQYASLFGENFQKVDNSSYDNKDALQKVYKSIRKFTLDSRGPTANQWIAQQLAAKNNFKKFDRNT